jgi:hypothetical protein
MKSAFTSLGWALVGGGQPPRGNPHPDWVATIQSLLDAGAALDGIVLSADDPKPPSSTVARVLRARGVPEETPGG